MKAFHNFGNMQNFTKSINNNMNCMKCCYLLLLFFAFSYDLLIPILFYLNVFVFCIFRFLHFAGFVCLLLTFSPLLPSSAPVQASARLSWFYSQLLQPADSPSEQVLSRPIIALTSKTKLLVSLVRP